MEKMLQFNPKNRITSEEALRDSYFDDIREADLEKGAEVPAELLFDD